MQMMLLFWMSSQPIIFRWIVPPFTNWITIHHNIGNVYKHWGFTQFSKIYFSSTSKTNDSIRIRDREHHWETGSVSVLSNAPSDLNNSAFSISLPRPKCNDKCNWLVYEVPSLAPSSIINFQYFNLAPIGLVCKIISVLWGTFCLSLCMSPALWLAFAVMTSCHLRTIEISYKEWHPDKVVPQLVLINCTGYLSI